MTLLPPYRAGNPGRYGGVVTDADVALWAAQVVTNGGTVSASRIALMTQSVVALKAAEVWALRDDFWFQVAENAIQALTSLKQRRLGVAVNSPAFTPDRGYLYDSTTNYVNTGFIPSTHAVVMTPTSCGIAGYVRTMTVAGCIMGVNQSTGRSIRIFLGTGAGTTANIDSQCGSAAYTAAPTMGMYSGARAGGVDASTVAAYFNGVPLVRTIAPTVFAVAHATAAIFIGCRNNGGVLSSGLGGTVGYVDIGVAMTPAQVAARDSIIQAHMAALGAAV